MLLCPLFPTTEEKLCPDALAPSVPPLKTQTENKNMKKNCTASIPEIRTRIVRLNGKKLQNVYNHDRFSDLFTPEHVEKLATQSESFQVIYIAKEKVLDPRLTAILKKFAQMEVRFLPSDQYDLSYELLIVDDKAFIASRENDSELTAEGTADAKIIFSLLWEKATPII